MRSYNIQALRALAAYAVVGHHIVNSLRDYLAIGRFTANPQIGATGVDLFFVISGYVILLSTLRKPTSPGLFFLNRLERIVPLYWILTLVATACILCGLKLFGSTPTDGWRIFSSLYFIPNFDAHGKMILPILFPGWTLDYEMVFYVLFALWLFIPNKTIRIAGLIASILLIWALHFFTGSTMLRYLGGDIVLAFALGIALWPLTQRYVLPAGPAFAAIPLGLLAMATVDMPFVARLAHGQILVSLGAGLVVYAAISLERAGRVLSRDWIIKQGDASYALYLIHPFVLQLLGKICLKLHLNTSVAGLAVTVVLMLVGSGIAGLLVHRHIENPLNRLMRGKSLEASMAGGATPPSAAPAAATPDLEGERADRVEALAREVQELAQRVRVAPGESMSLADEARRIARSLDVLFRF